MPLPRRETRRRRRAGRLRRRLDRLPQTPMWDQDPEFDVPAPENTPEHWIRVKEAEQPRLANEGGVVKRRPRYMNEGGIASLMSNGGSEAMMLELEGDAAALPGDLFSDEHDPRWLSHPEDEGYLPEAQIRRQLQRKAGSQIGEWVEDLTDMFDMQEAYDEELEVLESGGSFSSLSPELMERVGEMIFPGGGMVKMVKGATKVGKQALKDVRKKLDMDEYSPKGQDPRPPILGTERSQRPELPKYIPDEPPTLRSGGALSYKKGYYGKSYK